MACHMLSTLHVIHYTTMAWKNWSFQGFSNAKSGVLGPRVFPAKEQPTTLISARLEAVRLPDLLLFKMYCTYHPSNSHPSTWLVIIQDVSSIHWPSIHVSRYYSRCISHPSAWLIIIQDVSSIPSTWLVIIQDVSYVSSIQQPSIHLTCYYSRCIVHLLTIHPPDSLL